MRQTTERDLDMFEKGVAEGRRQMREEAIVIAHKRSKQMAPLRDLINLNPEED
jgi:hypothetical protein